MKKLLLFGLLFSSMINMRAMENQNPESSANQPNGQVDGTIIAANGLHVPHDSVTDEQVKAFASFLQAQKEKKDPNAALRTEVEGKQLKIANKQLDEITKKDSLTEKFVNNGYEAGAFVLKGVASGASQAIGSAVVQIILNKYDKNQFSSAEVAELNYILASIDFHQKIIDKIKDLQSDDAVNGADSAALDQLILKHRTKISELIALKANDGKSFSIDFVKRVEEQQAKKL